MRAFLVWLVRGCADIFTTITLALHDLLPKRKITIEKNKVLVNCAERLGDAIATMPILFAIEKKYDVTVITTAYNDEVLRPFFKTEIFEKSVRQGTLDKFLDNVLKDAAAFTILCGWYLESRLANKNYEYDVFFNRSAGTEPWHYALSRSRYVVGFKRYWAALFDSIVEPLDLAPLGIDVKSDSEYISRTIRRIDEFVGDAAIPRVREPYLLVNVGCKAQRNLPEEAWLVILDKLARFGESEGIRIVVMDNRENDTIAKLMPRTTPRKNLIFIQNGLSLWQGYKMAKRALVYLGMDIGPSHLLQLPTNAALIFTSGDHRTWRPYAMNWRKTMERAGNTLEEGTIEGLRKAVFYKETPCRPHGEGRCEKCCGLDPIFVVDGMVRLVHSLNES